MSLLKAFVTPIPEILENTMNVITGKLLKMLVHQEFCSVGKKEFVILKITKNAVSYLCNAIIQWKKAQYTMSIYN